MNNVIFQSKTTVMCVEGEGVDTKAEIEAIWHACTLRNDRIKAATGVTFRPFDESLRDCVESLVAIAGVETGTFTAKM